MKKAIIIAMLLAITGIALADVVEFSGKSATIKVINDEGRIRSARRDGNTIFSAPLGSEYSVVITNRTGGRILAVPTVDGLNVIDRSRGDWDGSGYVIEPYGEVEIKGFRRKDSFQHVERFTFNEARFSLADRIGDVRNVGVIGAAVFQEYVPPRYELKDMACESAAPSAARAKCDSRAGTEAGRTVNDPVRRVEFQRATATPSEILALYYDKEENLVSAGLLPPPFCPSPTGFLSPFPSNYVKGN